MSAVQVAYMRQTRKANDVEVLTECLQNRIFLQHVSVTLVQYCWYRADSTEVYYSVCPVWYRGNPVIPIVITYHWCFQFATNIAHSALTLLVGRQEEHPACKNRVMRCWCGRLSGARCRLFAYGPSDATAVPKAHHLLPHLNPDWFYLSAAGLPVALGKRSLNGCSSSSSSS